MRSLIARWLLGLCLGLALRHTSIELLEGVKEFPSFLSDGPVSTYRWMGFRPKTSRLGPRLARRPLGPACVKADQALLDELKTSSAVRLPGSIFSMDS